MNHCVRLIGAVALAATTFGCSILHRSAVAQYDERSADTSVNQISKLDDPYVAQESDSVAEDQLAGLLTLYNESLKAHEDGDFGLAETKLDSAAVFASTIDLDAIEDENIGAEYRRVLADLYREYGNLLAESAVIAQEDPTTLLEEFSHTDLEQFKSGQWNDDELLKIVKRIALRCDVPIDYNEKVKNAIVFFQSNPKGREAMTKWIRRSGTYLPFIQRILEEEGLPHDMVYLSMIESGFSPQAYSSARAVGLWQFIYSTGRLYGLDRDEWVDERRDPEKATRAAAQHLKDLYRMYNDWNLVMAAYNCGPSRVTRQVVADEEIEYWEMNLPRETQNYVPYFMAAVIICKAPELFGFEGIEQDTPLEYEEVEVRPYTSLASAASCIGVSADVLKALNPELRNNRVPPGKVSYQLKIPTGMCDTFVAAYNDIPAETYTPPKVGTYAIRRGDTLAEVARRHGVSLNSLMNANPGVVPNRLRVGQRIRIPGASDGGEEVATTVTTPARSSSASAAPARSAAKTTTYKVRRGDNLSSIADRFGTTVANLQSLNKFGSRTRIYLGQTLRVPASETSVSSGKGDSIEVASAVDAESAGKATKITYVVKKNDTLYDIARRYNVDHRDIMLWNRIKDHRYIKPGDRITIMTTNE